MVAGTIAARKERSVTGGVILGIFLGWLGVGVLLLLRDAPPSTGTQRPLTSGVRTCPDCGVSCGAFESRCHHCGHDFSDRFVPSEAGLTATAQAVKALEPKRFIKVPPGTRRCATGSCEAFGMPTPLAACSVCGWATQPA